MGYSGGTYIRPIKSGADKIAQLYLDGKRQVTAIRDQVRQQRSAEMNAYAKVASQLEATGVAEADKLYQSAANQLRELASQAHMDNVLGLTSRSVATATINNLTSQASQLANVSKLVAKNTEALDKGILDNSLDSLSKAGYLRGWFTGKTTMKIPDEKGGYVNTPVTQVLTTEVVDNKLHFRKTVDYYNPNTKKTETVTHLVPISDLGDLSSSLIKKFDDVEAVKDFQSILSSKKEVETVKGLPEGDSLGYFKVPGVDDMYARIVNPASFNNVINFMENDLNESASDDDKVLSFLSTNYMARAIGDEGFKGIKTQEELKKLLGATQVIKDGKPTGQTIPKHYDELGKQIEFEKDKKGNIIDPFVLQRDGNGNYIVTKTQREFFKARMRDKFLASMNITVDTFRNREEVLKESGKTQDISGTPFVYDKAITTGAGDKEKTTIEKANIDYDYMRSILSINNKYITNQNFNAKKEEAEMSRKGYVTAGTTEDEEPKGAMPTIGEEYFKTDDEFKAVSLGPNWNKLIKESNMTFTTIHDGVMESPSALMYSEQKNGKRSFFFVGRSTLIKPKSEIEMAIAVKGREGAATKTTEFARTGEINTMGVAPIKSADLSIVYKLFYNNDPKFRDMMGKAGYNKDGYNSLKEKKKTDYAHAIYTYIKAINR